ncbi:flavin reductase family protein [Nonomuraea sp. NPDC050643]|uniref:flavin reductase family protein n=1 Tax=Nonomuraea sp. NPDC050643 TaxID=3155660 RepID=UPI0033F42F70
MTTSATAPAQQGAVDGATLRGFMRRWATGVAVVTGSRDGRPAGCTVNAFTSVSLNPPLLLVSLATTSHTLASIIENGVFGVNLLAWPQRHLVAQFAAPAEDRFAGVDFRLVAGAPVIEGAMAAAVCAVTQTIAAADHVLVLGAPQWCDAGEGEDPALFFGGAFVRLGF